MRKEELGLELGWKWKAGDRSKKKEMDKADPAALFVDRNLQLLKPGGRLLIVVPDGILCNSGDAYIREYIMGSKDEVTGEFLGGKAILKAVVSLRQKPLPFPVPVQRPASFICKKRDMRPKNKVLFLWGWLSMLAI